MTGLRFRRMVRMQERMLAMKQPPVAAVALFLRMQVVQRMRLLPGFRLARVVMLFVPPWVQQMRPFPPVPNPGLQNLQQVPAVQLRIPLQAEALVHVRKYSPSKYIPGRLPSDCHGGALDKYTLPGTIVFMASGPP